MNKKTKEILYAFLMIVICVLIFLISLIPDRIRQKNAEEKYRYLKEEIEETGRALDELQQKSNEAKEKLLRDLEYLE